MIYFARRIYAVLALLVQCVVGTLLLPESWLTRVPVFRYDLAWSEFRGRWRVAPLRVPPCRADRPLRKPLFILVLEISVLTLCFPILVLICGVGQVLGQFQDSVYDYQARRAGRLR